LAAPANKDEVEEEVNKEREAGVKLDSELRKSPVVASIESGPGTAFKSSTYSTTSVLRLPPLAAPERRGAQIMAQMIVERGAIRKWSQ
jgi:hypothetical protein